MGEFFDVRLAIASMIFAVGAAVTPALADPNNLMDPANPASPLSLSNPANPASPLNLSNPANPASPLNPSNPANPASPLNPANPANLMNPANPASPLNPANQPKPPGLADWDESPSGAASNKLVELAFWTGKPYTYWACKLGVDFQCPSSPSYFAHAAANSAAAVPNSKLVQLAFLTGKPYTDYACQFGIDFQCPSSPNYAFRRTSAAAPANYVPSPAAKHRRRHKVRHK